MKNGFCAVFLAVALLLPLTACGTKQAQVAEGGYVATRITPEYRGYEPPKLIFPTENGLRMYNADLSLQWDSYDNGATWQQTKGPLDAAEPSPKPFKRPDLPPEYVYVQNENIIWMCFHNKVMCSRDDTMEKISFAPLEETLADKNMHVSDIKAAGLPNGNILLSYCGYNVEEETSYYYSFLYNPHTGEILQSYFDQRVEQYVAGEKYFYIVTNMGEIFQYDMNSGVQEPGKKAIAADNFFADPHIFCISEGDALLDAHSSGFRLFPAGQENSDSPEPLFQGSAFPFGDPEGRLNSVYMHQNTLYIITTPPDQYEEIYTKPFEVYRLDWDPELAYKAADTLRVWSLHDDVNIRHAAGVYSRLHGDYTVLYEPPNLAHMTEQDAITALVAELLAGNGPDIVVLDGLDIASLISQELLLDIAPYINTQNVNPSALGHFVEDGKIYALPASIKMPVLAAGEDIPMPVTVQELARLARDGQVYPSSEILAQPGMYLPRQHGARPAIWFASCRELLEGIWPLHAPYIVQDGNVNREALATLLEQAVDFSGACGGIPKEPSPNAYIIPDWYVMRETEDGRFASLELSFKLSMQTMFAERADYGLQTIHTLYELMGTTGSFITRQRLQYAPLMSEHGAAWRPATIMGVPQHCSNPAKACEFIQTVLADSVQARSTFRGFPVSQSSADKLKIDFKRDLLLEDEGWQLEGFNFNALVSNLGKPDFSRPNEKEWVFGPAMQYMCGECSLEQAMQAVEDNYALYLNEKK